MKTIKLGQQYQSPFNNLFVFAKIDIDTYGMVCIKGNGFFNKDSNTIYSELDKNNAEKVFKSLYSSGHLIPQNITVESYFNQISVEEIPVGSKFIENEVTYTRISSGGLDIHEKYPLEFVWAISPKHVVVRFAKNVEVTKVA